MIRPRKQLPIPDGDAPKSGGRPPPPLPSDDNDPPPPVPGRRPPPPVPEPEKHSDSSYESDSDFDADSDESYEKMRDKLSPPAIPNRGYRQSAQQREDFHSPMAQPRSSRAPPPGRSHDSSPRPPPPSRVLPNLPPTPGKRGVPQPPIKPEEQEVYDDGEAGDIYEEDVEVGEPEDFYDDGEVGQEVYNDLEDTPPPIPAAPRRNLPPPPPQTGRPPLPQEPQDVYEVEPEPDPIPAQPTPEESGESIYEMEPTVSDDQPSKPPPQLPNRPRAVPAPPQETYEIQDDEQENYDEFDVADSQETYDEFEQGPGEVYEDVNDDDTPKLPGRHVPPPPPAPAPLKSTPPPPKTKAPPVSKPTPKPPIGGGPGGIDLSAIVTVKLKKVGVPIEDRPKASETEKIYDEDGGVKSAFEKFKLKDMQSSGTLPLPKSSAAVATSLKKSVTQGKPDLHPRPAKKPENTNSAPTSPGVKSPALPKPRSPSPSKDSAPPPPPIKSVPDKPPAVPYTQVKPHTSVTNGNKLGVQEDPISSDDEDDDIYDDAISNRDPLLGEPWYFKSLKDRKTGDKLLKKVGKDGTFLIRESTKQGNFQPYTMMVLYQNNIYNLKIRVRSDGKMALGEEKPDEMSFMDVQKLVKYHRETEVILVGNTGQHKTLLKYSPPHD